jgi:hypothetical protein
MLTLKRRNHTLPTRPETTGTAESRNRFEGCVRSQTRSTVSAPTAGCDDSISIEDILNMRVGCWRPPVYVSDGPPR